MEAHGGGGVVELLPLPGGDSAAPPSLVKWLRDSPLCPNRVVVGFATLSESESVLSQAVREGYYEQMTTK